LGLDLDPHALELADQRLQAFSGRYTLEHTSYTTLLQILKQIGWDMVDGIVIAEKGARAQCNMNPVP